MTNPKDIHCNVLSLALKENFAQQTGFKLSDYQKYYWKNRITDKCKLIDCDQYCRIYIGIAQMANLPIKVIHIPDHYYIRWYFPDGKYVSWNPNDATLHPTETTMDCYYKVEASNKSYFKDYYPNELTTDDVVKNYKLLWADNIWDEKPVITIYQARDIYLQLIEENYTGTGLYNNFVWLHIMNPELDGTITITELHNYIDKLISLETDLNFYDAKACLFAMENKFKLAIDTENKGLALNFDKNNKRKKAEAHLDSFRQNDTGRTIK